MNGKHMNDRHIDDKHMDDKRMDDKRTAGLFENIDPNVIEKTDLEMKQIPDELLNKAGIETIKKIKREALPRRSGLKLLKKNRFIPAAAAILILVLGTGLLMNSLNPLNLLNSLPPLKAIASPKYPDKISFHDYEGNRSRREEIDDDFLMNLKDFSFKASSAALMSDDDKKNMLFSPTSLYMALALAARSADGETRSEILTALSMDSMEMTAIDQQTGRLFRSLFINNEIGRLAFANSLWLNKDVNFNQGFLQIAADDYYAYSYSVDFGSEDTGKQIAQWISKSTNGKLGNNSTPINTNPDQVMALINTVYFYDEWTDRFDPGKTKKDKFYLADGSTVNCDFMNITFFSKSFSRGEGYTVSSLGFKNNQNMIFILPNEGVSPYDLIKDPRLLSDAVNDLGSEDAKSGEVIFQIPKFSYTTSLKLNDTLRKLGIIKAFDMNEADFTPLSDFKPLFISNVEQSVRISIDEKGCEAAAYTKIDYVGSALPDDRAEMILNRPFIFAITRGGGIPLFIGVINNPIA